MSGCDVADQENLGHFSLSFHILHRLWVPVPLHTPHSACMHLPSQDAAARGKNNNLSYCSPVAPHIPWLASRASAAEQAGTAAITMQEDHCCGASGSLLDQPRQFLPAVPVSALRCIGQVSMESIQAHAMFRTTKQNEKWCCLLLPSGKLPLANGFIIFIISCLICFTILAGTIAKT